MSVETFSPLPLNIFGTWITLLDPSDVPPGMSPSCADVAFFPGGVQTRPGLASQFSPLSLLPQVNGLKTYITPNLTQRLLVLDSLGNLYKEVSPGTLSPVAANTVPNLYLGSCTQFGREYMDVPTGRSDKICHASSTTPISIESARWDPGKDPPWPTRRIPAASSPGFTSAW